MLGSPLCHAACFGAEDKGCEVPGTVTEEALSPTSPPCTVTHGLGNPGQGQGRACLGAALDPRPRGTDWSPLTLLGPRGCCSGCVSRSWPQAPAAPAKQCENTEPSQPWSVSPGAPGRSD